MPLGLRIVRKVEAIVREEMNRAGAVELAMPVGATGGIVAGIRPLGEVWSGTVALQGPASAATSLIQPTSEEVVTRISRAASSGAIANCRRISNQIQTKFRDDAGRAWHHARARVHDEGRLLVSRRLCRPAARIPEHVRHLHPAFSRALGLKFRAVAATPAHRRTGSHEFHVLADSGEDAVAYCPESDFAAQYRTRRSAWRASGAPPRPPAPMRKMPTPGTTRCEDVGRSWARSSRKRSRRSP